MDTKGQFSLSCGLVSPVSLLLFVFIGLGSFSFSVPPVGSKVTTIPCSLGDSSEGAIAPLGHPWAGLEAFPDAHQTDVQHYRRQSYSLLPTVPMLGYKKSLLFVQGHMLV